MSVDIVTDTIGPGSPRQVTRDAIGTLRRGGKLVEIGSMTDPLPINMHQMMCSAISLICAV
ncbi:hypothetical protein [Paraburkholderia oxyphila]|uniref:hypothetical protein n=1 Tax=Paraburkholderia oxyphila TaxID=614212 RepID=UPI0005BA289D|nr:hypothetical protein [Paraburkholderia oxyphila]